MKRNTIALPNHATAAYAAEAKWRREQDIESTGERLTLEQRRQAGIEHCRRVIEEHQEMLRMLEAELKKANYSDVGGG